MSDTNDTRSGRSGDRSAVPIRCKCGQAGVKTWADVAVPGAADALADLFDVSNGFFVRMQNSKLYFEECERLGDVKVREHLLRKIWGLRQTAFAEEWLHQGGENLAGRPVH